MNQYLKIEPLEHKGFVVEEKTSYEEIGKVVAVADGIDIPIGARVFFDSYIAKKYPDLKKEGKYQWFVPLSEVVKYDVA